MSEQKNPNQFLKIFEDQNFKIYSQMLAGRILGSVFIIYTSIG